MSKKQPTKPLERTFVSAKDVREIARQLAYFTSVYEGAADEMDKSELGELDLKGATNLYLSLERMNGSVQSLQSSLFKARTTKLKRTIQQDVEDRLDAGPPEPQKPKRKGAKKS